MASSDLYTLAMRAVERTVVGRADPRLLVATKRTLGSPRKVARLLAGLVNASGGRRSLLLIGMTRDDVTGIAELPGPEWWQDLERAFPGPIPGFESLLVDIDGARVLALAPTLCEELVPVEHRGEVYVPFFDRGGLRRTPPTHPLTPAPPESDTTITVSGGHIDRSPIRDRDVVAYHGRLDLELGAVSAVIADESCSATLLDPTRDRPVELDVQLHPTGENVGVVRIDGGIRVVDTFRARLLVAAAVRSGLDLPDPDSIQVVLSLTLPGRTEPDLRSLLFGVDPGHPGRWRL